ncbi:hypothetical protein ONS95_014356 [Cadophora gregata]|uniref:uncharacterized protein n=1 Tax=Cadophora gregata TaxID=51156 RepID=UPI0026DB0BD6|nr:uncharacterized protein ONS95_014356 [Cadophora gregata]KAK0112613.1 hypothetical protein ONS95_014356 [Cadophora gregata]
MRMLSMQLHKLQNLEKAMRDGEPKERAALSLKQLANLFGFLRTDGDGDILSVEADYQEDEGGGGGGGGSHDGGGDFNAGEFLGGSGDAGASGQWGGQNWGRGESAEHQRFGWKDVGMEGYGHVMEVEDEDEDI